MDLILWSFLSLIIVFGLFGFGYFYENKLNKEHNAEHNFFITPIKRIRVRKRFYSPGDISTTIMDTDEKQQEMLLEMIFDEIIRRYGSLDARKVDYECRTARDELVYHYEEYIRLIPDLSEFVFVCMCKIEKSVDN